jgi:hypothetical protein
VTTAANAANLAKCSPFSEQGSHPANLLLMLPRTALSPMHWKLGLARTKLHNRTRSIVPAAHTLVLNLFMGFKQQPAKSWTWIGKS